jgi:hypothetical protein
MRGCTVHGPPRLLEEAMEIPVVKDETRGEGGDGSRVCPSKNVKLRVQLIH